MGEAPAGASPSSAAGKDGIGTNIMRTRRVFTSLFAAIVVATAAYAAAANLVVSTRSLGAGGAVVASCGTGFTITYNLGESNAITSVTVADIPAACDGGALQVVLVDDSGAAIGSGSGAAATGSVQVSIADAPHAEDVEGVYLAIVGGGS